MNLHLHNCIRHNIYFVISQKFSTHAAFKSIYFPLCSCMVVLYDFSIYFPEMERTIAQQAMTKLTFPFAEEKIRALKVGDEVLISGVVFTGRGIGG